MEFALHVAPQTPFNRIAGSVLSVVYELGGAKIKEWAFVSQGHSDPEHANVVAHRSTMDCIRVMGWAGFVDSSSAGTGSTDWRLFRGVMQTIEGMARSQPWLCLQKRVLFVDAFGRPAKPVEVECTRPQKPELLTFALASDGSEEEPREVTVFHEDVIPSGTEVRLEATGSRMPQLDPALRERFRANGLSAEVCEQVCSDLGVGSLADLKDVEERDVWGLKLKPVQANKLLKLVQEAKKEPPC